jgi:Cft2 family RNA processing exonuclease
MFSFRIRWRGASDGERSAMRRCIPMNGNPGLRTVVWAAKDLVTWLGALAQSKPRVILTHGEDEPRNALARLIQNRFGHASRLPAMGETIEL